MSEFIVDADVLANARFGTSQLTETVSALKMLLGPSEPWYRPWRDTHVETFETELTAHPVWKALVEFLRHQVDRRFPDRSAARARLGARG